MAASCSPCAAIVAIICGFSFLLARGGDWEGCSDVEVGLLLTRGAEALVDFLTVRGAAALERFSRRWGGRVAVVAALHNSPPLSITSCPVTARGLDSISTPHGGKWAVVITGLPVPSRELTFEPCLSVATGFVKVDWSEVCRFL